MKFLHDVIYKGLITSEKEIRIGHSDTPLAYLDVRAGLNHDIGAYFQNGGGTGNRYAVIAQAQQQNSATTNIAGYFNAQYGGTNYAIRTDSGDVVLNILGGSTSIGTTSNDGYKLNVYGTGYFREGVTVSDFAGANTTYSLLAYTNSNTQTFGVKNGGIYTTGAIGVFDNYSQPFYFYTNRGYYFYPANSRSVVTSDWMYVGGPMYVAGGTPDTNNGWISVKPTFNYNGQPDTGSKFIGFYYNPSNYQDLGTQHYAMVLEAGAVQLGDLSGTNTRMVTADSSGKLSTQTIPEVISLTNNGEYKIITGTSTANSITGASKLSWYNDFGILALKATASWGYGAQIDFDNTEVNGTQWGFYGGSTEDTGFMLYRYLPSQVELAYWNTDRYSVRSDVKIGWSSTLLSFNAMDTALAREAAGLVQINNGSLNNYASLKLLNLTATGLAGTGTRMVTVDSNGLLGSQAIPSGGSNITTLSSLTDVSISSLTNNQLLKFDSTSNKWINWTSNYLTSYTETDPVFVASAAYGITSTNISNWNTAYGWGNHATAGYLTTSSAASNYVALTGTQTVAGAKTFSSTLYAGSTLSINGGSLQGNNIVSMRANAAGGQFRIERSDGTLCQYPFYVGSNGNPASYFYATDGTTLRIVFQIDTPSYFYNKLAIGHSTWTAASAITEMLEVNGYAKATGFKTGGTSSQFLKADGSIDSTAYYPNSNPNGYTSNTGTVTSVSGTGTVSGLTLSGTVTTSGSLTLGGTLTLTSANVTTALGYTPYNSTNPNGYITSSGSITGSAGSVAWSGVTGKPTTLSGYGITDSIKTNGTITGNIDSDWGESFTTFDPVPSGTPPLSSPNIRTINIGNNFARRTQLAFDYASDVAYFRRRSDAGWSNWREFIHSGNIGSQSVNYATTAGSANSVAWTSVTGRPTALSSFTNDTNYITSASVGNGTLTLNVSGTGLSGSTSFTANQSSNTTFTVTSNATSSNTASTIVARDASGNFSAGTITATLSGNASTASSAVTLSTTRSNWSSNGTISAVVGQLSWKNYGNGHTIFDASAGTSPDGGAVNNTNSQVAWSATYPTLMGWNGTNTYGVRVDTSRYAETAGTANGVAWTNVSGRPTALSSFTNDTNYITSASVGNGTLTMNVSGTGLSGSATFTANQSGAATFTVSSNATSANTASTIVARDSSGNFSAGTITANLSGNASTVTSITSSQVTTALGYTPYNSTNPNGYVTSSSLSAYLPLAGGTMTGGLQLNSSLTINSSATSDVANGMRTISHSVTKVGDSLNFIRINGGTNNVVTGWIFVHNFDNNVYSTGSGSSFQFAFWTDGSGVAYEKYFDQQWFGGNNIGIISRVYNVSGQGNGLMIRSNSSTGAGGYKCQATVMFFARDMSKVTVQYY